MMRKSIHTKDYAEFLKLLIETRLEAGVTQVQLGKKLPFGQSGISKIERGERRIDVIELRSICSQLNIDFLDFMQRLEVKLSKGRGRE
jgi:transcriptional regulator with XRE-family HTH domain